MSSQSDTNPTNYLMCSILGHSSSNIAVVYLARHNPSNSLVAIKKYNMDQLTEEHAELIQDEIIIMRKLSHQNVLKCLSSFVIGSDILTVTPLQSYRSCRDLITCHFNMGLPELAIAMIVKDVLQALNYIHSMGYIHRAVRASHILVNEKCCVLTGLRYACPTIVNSKVQRKVHSFPASTANNLNWLSPEVLQQNLLGYNEKSDVYSLGITVCELANGLVPYYDMTSTLMLTEKLRANNPPQLYDCSTYFVEEDSGPELSLGENAICTSNNDKMKEYASRKFSDPFHAFNELCLLREPTERPTPFQLLNHPFFKQIRRSNLSLREALLPAVPITEQSISHYQGDLRTLLITNHLSALDLSSFAWDF